MRAGLFSQSAVVERINNSLVATWILVDHAQKLGEQGDPFCRELAEHWGYPLDLIFLDSEGRFLSKLNSFEHMTTDRIDHRQNIRVFMDEVEKHAAPPPIAPASELTTEAFRRKQHPRANLFFSGTMRAKRL